MVLVPVPLAVCGIDEWVPLLVHCWNGESVLNGKDIYIASETFIDKSSKTTEFLITRPRPKIVWVIQLKILTSLGLTLC